MLPIYRVGASQRCYGCPPLENKALGQKDFNGFGKIAATLLAIICLAGGFALAQDQSQTPPPQQDIPDAPSATRPANPFPSNLPPAPKTGAPQPTPPPNQAPPTDAGSSSNGGNPPPMPPVKTVPPGSIPADQGELNSPEDLYKIVKTVNFVVVPVTVKDGSGHLVDGLRPKDFTVLEDGKKQELKLFIVDPLPLSAAIVLDTGMPDVALQKVAQTYTALAGSFSPYDEVSLYTYSSTVSQVSDFSAVGDKLTAVFNRMKLERGGNNGAPVMNGPLGPQGPTVNGIPVERPGAQPNIAPPKDVRVMNDAVVRAALDLSKRDRARQDYFHYQRWARIREQGFLQRCAQGSAVPRDHRVCHRRGSVGNSRLQQAAEAPFAALWL